MRVNFIQARGAIGSIGTVMYRVFVEGVRKVGIELGVPGDAPDAALVDSVWSAIDKVALRGTTLQDMSRAGLDFTVGQKGSAAAAVDREEKGVAGAAATATAEQKAQVHVGDRDRKAMARAGLIEVEPGHWARAPGPSMDSRAEKAEAKPKK